MGGIRGTARRDAAMICDVSRQEQSKRWCDAGTYLKMDASRGVHKAPAFNRRAASMTGAIRAFPGVHSMLDQIRETGLCIGVITGKARQRALPILESTRLLPMVDVLVTPDDAPGKPDPEALFQCINRLGGAQPLFFVDDTDVNRRTAAAAGIPSALAAWGLHPAATVSEGWDWHFHSPAEAAFAARSAVRRRRDMKRRR